MATNKKRKNRGKGAGAMERKRRMAQRNQDIRERHRYDVPHDTDYLAMAAILGIHLGKR